jgi:hypothetical protein
MRKIGSTTVVFLIVSFWGNVNASDACILSNQQSDNLNPGQSKELEKQAFKKYYQGVTSKDIPQALDLAQKYLDQFPGGQYAAYLRMWVRAVHKRAEIERRGVNPKVLTATSAGGQTEGSDSMLRSLIDESADVNLKMQDGKTVLMLAAEMGQTDIVKAMILRGANVNAKSTVSGWTALFFAIWHGYAETVQALIDGGADVNIKDEDEASALEIAIMADDPEIVKLLKKAGARQ